MNVADSVAIEAEKGGQTDFDAEPNPSGKNLHESEKVSHGQSREQGNKNGEMFPRREARKGERGPMLDLIREDPIKVTARVLVPVHEHPKFNFVGKLLGPKGNSLKRLQECTMTKMTILGRGSMKDKTKEEELRSSGDPMFSHLKEDLHVEISAFAPPAEAHARIAHALADVRPFLVPDYNDDIRQEQMREMQVLKEAEGRDDSPKIPSSSVSAKPGSIIHSNGSGNNGFHVRSPEINEIACLESLTSYNKRASCLVNTSKRKRSLGLEQHSSTSSLKKQTLFSILTEVRTN